jgi:hypothetical protein
MNNWYPLLHIDDLFDRFSKAKMFNRIDLHLGGITKFELQKGTKKRLLIAQGMAHTKSW